MMQRYELTGSGVGDFMPDVLATVAKRNGAKRIRAACHNGWENQPETIQFDAIDDAAADKIGRAVMRELYSSYRAALGTSLSPMLRAYGLHWEGFGK